MAELVLIPGVRIERLDVDRILAELGPSRAHLAPAIGATLLDGAIRLRARGAFWYASPP